MPLFADRAICVRKFEYSETSQILSLFCHDQGLVRVIAKGAHRRTKAGAAKFGGGIDLLELGQAVFIHDTNRELGTLTEWTLVNGHLPLRNTLRGLYLGLYAAELIPLLINEHDPHPKLFERLLNLLDELETPAREESFLAFELDLLREAGYALTLDSCSICGRPLGDRGTRAFSPSHGGLICSGCQSSIPDRMSVDPRLAGLLRMIARLPRAGGGVERLPRLTRHQTDPLNRLIGEHVRQISRKKPRLEEYVLQGPY